MIFKVSRVRPQFSRPALLWWEMTTGTSARAASRALLEGGAKEVRVWALARTLQQER